MRQRQQDLAEQRQHDLAGSGRQASRQAGRQAGSDLDAPHAQPVIVSHVPAVPLPQAGTGSILVS